MKLVSTSRGRSRGEQAATVLLLLVFAGPLVTIVVEAVAGSRFTAVAHLARTVLPMQLWSSALAGFGAVLVGGVLGVPGMLCALFDFPGRPVLERVLLLPLLVPTWFVAVLAQDRLGAGGASALVLVLGIGAAPVFQLFATAALRRIPRDYHECLRQLGRATPSGLLRALLPLAAPALGAAAVVTFLFAWGDDACARVLAVPTLTVGLYDQWFGRSAHDVGALMATVLLALGLLPTWALWRGAKRSSGQDDARLLGPPAERTALRGPARAVPWLLAIPLLTMGVLGPGWVIGVWTVERLPRVRLTTLGADLLTTVALAVAGTLVAALLALAMLRDRASARAPRIARAGTQLAVLTFALPPLVLGLAFLQLLPREARGPVSELLLSTPLPLCAAFGLRFCAVFLVLGDAALLRTARAHTDVLRWSGRTSLVSFGRLFRPWLSPPAMAAACFVFLRVLEDLSLTLVLRPFDFDTIGGRIFQYAQTQRIAECSVWILCLGLVGLYPLFLLARAVDVRAPSWSG